MWPPGFSHFFSHGMAPSGNWWGQSAVVTLTGDRGDRQAPFWKALG
jgi:hypothetical protein